MEDNLLVYRVSELEKTVQKIKHTVHGNGEQGLDDRVLKNESDIKAMVQNFDNLNRTIGTIEKERQKERDERIQERNERLQERSETRGMIKAYKVSSTIIIALLMIIAGEQFNVFAFLLSLLGG